MFDRAQKCVKQLHTAVSKQILVNQESKIRMDSLNDIQDRMSVGYEPMICPLGWQLAPRSRHGTC